MSETFEARLQAVDAALLTPLVQQALGDTHAEVLEWQQRPLLGGFAPPEAGVLGRILFSGSVHLHGEVIQWALVLKVLALPAGKEHQRPTDAFYWLREALAYQSSLLTDLQDGLVAPRCFAVVEYPNNECWVWMEYIVEEYQEWPLARYERAAQHLGQFNGRLLMQGNLPVSPWFLDGFTRQLVDWAAVDEQELMGLAQHPRSWATPQSAERMLHIYRERERLLAALAQLPQTLCHHDAHRRNLMARRTTRGEEQTVAIDWSVVGPGALGEEIAITVILSLAGWKVPASDAHPFENFVYTGYLAGVRQAGWQGDEALMRLGYTAAIALSTTALHTYFLRDILSDETIARAYEQAAGKPYPVICQDYRTSLEFCLDRGEEALTLL